MAKIVKNTTGSDYPVSDVGVTILANDEITISSENSLIWAASDDLVTGVGSGDLVINDGTLDLSISGGIDHIKGLFQKTIIDGDSAYFSRIKVATAGWTFQARGIQFTTSLLGSIINDDFDGNDLNDCIIKFYDNADVELTTQSSIDTDCVKTVKDWTAPFDIELVGGFISCENAITTDTLIWCVGAPVLADKVMINGVNLKMVDGGDRLVIDGRASKRMDYVEINGLYTNTMRMIVRHPAGQQTPLMIVWEHYKA